MIGFLTIGLILGLSAGIAPGPLLTLVISETLRHDVKAGIRVALAPIITDAPVIILTILLSASLSEFNVILGGISFLSRHQQHSQQRDGHYNKQRPCKIPQERNTG